MPKYLQGSVLLPSLTRLCHQCFFSLVLFISPLCIGNHEAAPEAFHGLAKASAFVIYNLHCICSWTLILNCILIPYPFVLHKPRTKSACSPIRRNVPRGLLSPTGNRLCLAASISPCLFNSWDLVSDLEAQL